MIEINTAERLYDILNDAKNNANKMSNIANGKLVKEVWAEVFN